MTFFWDSACVVAVVVAGGLNAASSLETIDGLEAINGYLKIQVG